MAKRGKGSFIRALQFNIEDPYGFYADRIDAETLVKLAKNVHANTLIVFARDAWGRTFYDSRLYPRHRRARLDVGELGRLAERHGVKLIVMAAHTANRYLYRKHPLWAQRTRDGEVIVLEHIPVEERVRDPHWPQICLNSPALDQYFVPEVQEAWETSKAYGVLLDSFRYMPDMPKACYCQWCRERFRSEEGLELPEKMDPEDEAYRRAWEWRYRVVVRALERIRNGLWEVSRGKARLYYNSHPAGWAGRPNRVVEMARDLLDGVFAEASEVDVKGPGLLTIVAKLSKALLGDDKPVLVTRNAFHFLRVVQSPPKQTIKQGIWEIVAAGGQPVVTIFSSQLFEDPRALEAVEEVYERLEAIEEYLVGAKPLKLVGLVYSNTTHDWYLHNHPEYYVGEVEGFADMLMHNHIPWGFVPDYSLEDLNALGEYRVLVLANTGVLSDEAEEAIARYVEEGGMLIATHQVGVMRPDFTYRQAMALEEVMGVRYEGLRRLGYVYLDLLAGDGDAYEEYWRGLPYRIPFGDYNTAFRRGRRDPRLGEAVRVVAEEARPLARLRVARNHWGYEYTLGRSLPPPDSLQETPGVTVNRYGRGVAIYYSLRLGIHYDRFGNPDYSALFTSVLERHGIRAPVRVEAPDTVQAEYYWLGECITVHLVNHTYNQRFLDAPVSAAARQALPAFDPPYSVHPIRTVIPVHGVKVVAETGWSRTVVRQPLESVETVVDGGRVEYQVEKLKDYTLVVLCPKK